MAIKGMTMNTRTATAERGLSPLNDESFGRRLIRFNTAGSVDNGKSTLIGRLLYDSGGLPEDVIATIAARSRESGKLNLAAFTDGLKAERERGITIDASYRYFQRGERDFIVADSPGHFEFTRNMLTATSHSDATLILVDAEHGIVEQNRRHAYLAAMAGVKNIAILVNKLDLVGFSQARFDAISGSFSRLLDKLPGVQVTYIPISALQGENIVESSSRMPWYSGPSVLGYLEHLSDDAAVPVDRLRAVVQWIEHAKTLASREVVVRLDTGTIHNGETLRASPRGHDVVVADLHAQGTFVSTTSAPHARFHVNRDARLQRGDVLSRADESPRVSQRIEAHICWMANTPLTLEGQYLVRIGSQLVEASLDQVIRRTDIGTFEEIDDARSLSLNDVGTVLLNLAEPVAATPFTEDRRGGALIVIDPRSGETVAAGGVLSA